MNDDLETRRIRAAEAKQFLENSLFTEMFAGVAESLHQVTLSCDPDDKDRAQRVVISTQLLESLKREITRRVDDGDFAAFQLQELKRRGPIDRIFRR